MEASQGHCRTQQGGNQVLRLVLVCMSPPPAPPGLQAPEPDTEQHTACNATQARALLHPEHQQRHAGFLPKKSEVWGFCSMSAKEEERNWGEKKAKSRSKAAASFNGVLVISLPPSHLLQAGHYLPSGCLLSAPLSAPSACSLSPQGGQ